jgi:hypothetical protein
MSESGAPSSGHGAALNVARPPRRHRRLHRRRHRTTTSHRSERLRWTGRQPWRLAPVVVVGRGRCCMRSLSDTTRADLTAHVGELVATGWVDVGCYVSRWRSANAVPWRHGVQIFVHQRAICARRVMTTPTVAPWLEAARVVAGRCHGGSPRDVNRSSSRSLSPCAGRVQCVPSVWPRHLSSRTTRTVTVFAAGSPPPGDEHSHTGRSGRTDTR